MRVQCVATLQHGEEWVVFPLSTIPEIDLRGTRPVKDWDGQGEGIAHGRAKQTPRRHMAKESIRENSANNVNTFRFKE